MLQRPQTLFMLAAVACLVLALAFPAFLAALPDSTHQLFTYGTRFCPAPEAKCATYEGHNFADGWQIGAGLLHLAALLMLGLALGSFKKRLLQIRLLALVNIAVFATLGFVLYGYSMLTAGGSFWAGLQVGAVALLLAPVLNLFAINRIRRDENLVRSMDRLR